MEPDEYDLWLQPEAGKQIPRSKFTKLGSGCKYTIPNTVSIVWGRLQGTDVWWNPTSIWFKFAAEMRAERTGFQRLGFLVIEDNAPPPWAVELRLQDPDVTVFLYAGHSTIPDGDLAPWTPLEDEATGRHINDAVSQRLYRRRSEGLPKLGFMKLLGCRTAILSEEAIRMGIQNKVVRWSSNVSTFGVFVGFSGSPNFWDSGDYKALPGTGGVRGE